MPSALQTVGRDQVVELASGGRPREAQGSGGRPRAAQVGGQPRQLEICWVVLLCGAARPVGLGMRPGRPGEEAMMGHRAPPKKFRESLLLEDGCVRVAWPVAQGASRANRRRRPIKLERARSFHLQIQACVCSGSAEDVSSLCRAKRLQVFIFQLDKDCDLSWREKGQRIANTL
jgi:hypothetical protein